MRKPEVIFARALKRRYGKTIFCLATSKDKASARLLLQSWGVSDIFPPKHIYDKERGLQKSAHLQAILLDFELEASEILFIDDKINHLLTAAAMGIPAVLAGWGHNTPREHLQAEEAGIPIAQLDDAEQQLFG